MAVRVALYPWPTKPDGRAVVVIVSALTIGTTAIPTGPAKGGPEARVVTAPAGVIRLTVPVRCPPTMKWPLAGSIAMPSRTGSPITTGIRVELFGGPAGSNATN